MKISRKKSLNSYSGKEVLEVVKNRIRYNSHQGEPNKKARMPITTMIQSEADLKRLLRFFKERGFKPRFNKRKIVGGGIRKELHFGMEETRRLKEFLGDIEEDTE